MANGNDISDDVATHVLEQWGANHGALMFETQANTGAAHNLVRLVGGKKFNEVDPIEAAATEMILNKK